MTKEDFWLIADKISNGTASEEDVRLFNIYYEYFQRKGYAEPTPENGINAEDTGKELYSRIRKDISGSRKLRHIAFPYTRIAAVVLFLLLSSLFFIINRHKDQSAKQLNTASDFKNDVLPGSNKAVLVLADGSKILLDESGNGLLAHQGNTSIRKTADGKLVYNSGENAESGNRSKSSIGLMNTISTPQGGQYQLTLPDGTKVWLNSSSTLRFPAVFDHKERIVELEGEAYFEVTAHSKQLSTGNGGTGERIPFRVRTRGQMIDVLGTHFNVSAYADETLTKTTLLEGSVRVSIPSGSDAKHDRTNNTLSKVLRPGQQAKVPSADKTEDGVQGISVNAADPEEAIAWKNGMFQFNNTDIYTIMKQLERWYGVDVDMSGMPERKFNGIIPRSVKLSQVLTMMEKTSGLKFRIEGRRVSMIK